MQALLIRVGIDLSEKSGHWNAPVDLETCEFAYVPILESRQICPKYRRSYNEFNIHCEKLGKRLPDRFNDKNAHLDPDFSYLTYGDIDGKDVYTGKINRKGKPIRELNDGDILVFYAGLKPIKSEPKEDRLVYAIIGLYIIDGKPIFAKDLVNKGERDKNAHTRGQYNEADIIVFAKRGGASGRLEKCIPISKRRGEGKHYRVTEKLLGEWGGLSGTKDGWIQRAILPSFCDPDKFYAWFQKECQKRGIQLREQNNLD